MNIIWQYLDKRSATINALKDYDSIQHIIAHTDEDIIRKKEALTSPKSPTFSEMPTGKSDSNAAENRIVSAMDEIDVLKERYRQAKAYMDWFLPAWKVLSEDERLVLKAFFWNEGEQQLKAVFNICQHFNIERTSAYKKKNRALDKLTLLLFGK